MRKLSPVTGQPAYPGGWQITSEFLSDSYFNDYGDWHTGHDLSTSNALGSPVYAAADGTVKWAENAGNNGFGNLVYIEHNPALFTRYGHLAEIRVTRQQVVTAGTVIGTVGSTGRSTGPHLHFDVMRAKNALDWPGNNRVRAEQDYFNPHEWYQDINGSKPPLTENEWLRVTATAELNVRARPSVTARILYRLPYQSIVEVKPTRLGADGYTWRELVSSGWIAEEYTEHVEVAGATTGGQGFTVILPTITWEPMVPIGLRGVHANAGGWIPCPAELDLVRHNGVDSVLIVAYEPGQAGAIDLFRSAGVRHFIFRAAHHGKPSANPCDFVDRTLPVLREYYAALGSGSPMLVLVHNEPNLTNEGFRSAWNSGMEFSAWYLQVARSFRDALPGVRIGFPAMSPGGNDVGVLADGSSFERQDEWTFVTQCSEAIRQSDWVGVHAYFVGDGSDVTLKPAQWRQMAQGRPIIITEGGPGGNITNSGPKLHNLYMKCSQAGFPVMAWLLSGAGAWNNADWLVNNVQV